MKKKKNLKKNQEFKKIEKIHTRASTSISSWHYGREIHTRVDVDQQLTSRQRDLSISNILRKSADINKIVQIIFLSSLVHAFGTPLILDSIHVNQHVMHAKKFYNILYMKVF